MPLIIQLTTPSYIWRKNSTFGSKRWSHEALGVSALLIRLITDPAWPRRCRSRFRLLQRSLA